MKNFVSRCLSTCGKVSNQPTIKVGYNAVLFNGHKRLISFGTYDTYEEAENDIYRANENGYNFTHASVEKVFYRSK